MLKGGPSGQSGVLIPGESPLNPHLCSGVSGYKIGNELKIFYWKDLRRVLGKPTVTTTTSASTLAEKDSQSSNLFSIVIKLEESTGSFAVTHLPKLEHDDEEGGSMTSSCEMEMKMFLEPERLKISEVLVTFFRKSLDSEKRMFKL